MRILLGIMYTHATAHDAKTAVIDNRYGQGVTGGDIHQFKGDFPVDQAVGEIAGPVVVGVL